MDFEYYNTIADSYEELYHNEQKTKYQAIKHYLENKKYKILDIGCGTGVAFEYFSNVTGLEPSSKMIEKSKNSTNIIEGLAKDINSLFTPKSFDLILCVTSLHHIKDLNTFKNNIHYVGKKQAKIVFSILHSAKSTNKLQKFIKNNFEITKEITILNDKIYFCRLKKFK